jgi:hypothetical protein
VEYGVGTPCSRVDGVLILGAVRKGDPVEEYTTAKREWLNIRKMISKSNHSTAVASGPYVRHYYASGWNREGWGGDTRTWWSVFRRRSSWGDAETRATLTGARVNNWIYRKETREENIG